MQQSCAANYINNANSKKPKTKPVILVFLYSAFLNSWDAISVKAINKNVPTVIDVNTARTIKGILFWATNPIATPDGPVKQNRNMNKYDLAFFQLEFKIIIPITNESTNLWIPTPIVITINLSNEGDRPMDIPSRILCTDKPTKSVIVTEPDCDEEF